MRTQVKICGLTRPQDVESAIEYGSDYLGFIVEAKSSRRLTVPEAAKLARPAKDIAKTVAVTVNASDDVLQAIMAEMAPNYIQCHGDESPERVAAIKSAFDVGVLKAIGVQSASDLTQIQAYKVDLILLDAKPSKGAVRGGHGVSFDWDILMNADLPENYLLAGGLTPENAREAIQRTNAPILDVSSGVESAPGIKDAALIQAFMDAAKKGNICG